MEKRYRIKVSQHLAEVIKDSFSSYAKREGLEEKVHLSIPETPFFIEYGKGDTIVYLSIEKVSIKESEVEIGFKDQDKVDGTLTDFINHTVQEILWSILKPFVRKKDIEGIFKEIESLLQKRG